MFWLTLWLAWFGKMLSIMEGTLNQPEAPPPPRGTAPPQPETAPARPEPVRKPPETASEPAQTAAPPHGDAPAKQGEAQAPEKTALKRTETAPQDAPPPHPSAWPMREVASPQLKAAPLSRESDPAGEEVATAQQESASSRQETALPPEQVSPPMHETAPQDALAPHPSARPMREVASPQQDAAPPSRESDRAGEEIAPAQQEITPAQQETATSRQETAPPPEQVAPPIHETAARPEVSPQRHQELAAKRQSSGMEKAGEGSMTWRKRPMIYEIPTWVWLDEQRAKHGAGLTLGTIPAAEWDEIAGLAVDAVWLMGVWERSPAGIAVSNANAEQQDEFRRLLPDYTLADNVGSAYCVRDYVVAEHLGGPAALAAARAELNARGLRLILDFVPNHVAIDHPWALQHPDYFVRGTAEDLVRAPTEFVEVKGQVLANGRDPYFAPWRDVLQLNAYHPQLRAAVIETVTSIAGQCDGMRCDMAMLLLNDIFQRTWGDRAGEKPATEYWQDVIPAVKAKYPNTLFIAEVYWDLEYEMMQKGFDYCYDKRLYDRLVGDNAESIRAHLTAGLDYQDRLVRFIENHDEPRAAATFYGAKERAAAVVIATTPGAKLVYDGQIEGRQVKLPVFLARRRPEAPNEELVLFYRALLGAVHTDLFHEGEWHLCERSGWPDNSSFHDIVAWTWRYRDHRTLIVVNLSAHPSQAMVHLSWDDLRGQTWRLVETLTWECYPRDGDDLINSGLFVNLDAWGYHFLKFE